MKMGQSGHNLNISKYRRGCTLPHERGISDTAPGQVVVRKATPEELAELERKLGAICPPAKAEQIRARCRSLAGIRVQNKKNEEERDVEEQAVYSVVQTTEQPEELRGEKPEEKVRLCKEEYLRLRAQGLSDREIATKWFGIALSTFYKHKRQWGLTAGAMLHQPTEGVSNTHEPPAESTPKNDEKVSDFGDQEAGNTNLPERGVPTLKNDSSASGDLEKNLKPLSGKELELLFDILKIRLQDTEKAIERLWEQLAEIDKRLEATVGVLNEQEERLEELEHDYRHHRHQVGAGRWSGKEEV